MVGTGRSLTALVTGYIGYQNTGDELLLRSLVRGIERHALPIRLSTLSRDPESTERIHHIESPRHPAFGGSVRPSLRTRWIRTRAIMDCDLLILGPGGLLQDYDSRGIRNIFSVLRMVMTARATGARVAGVGIGAGPLVTTQGRRIAGYIGRLSDLLLVRDNDSIALLRSLGVPETKLRKAADLALVGGWNIPPRLPNTPPVLGVSIFNFYDYIHGDASKADAYRRVVANALDGAASRGIRIRFISMQGAFGGNDEQEAVRIRELMRATDQIDILPYTDDPENTLHSIAQCDWFLGMRLHSLIMALLGSVPMAALSYHPKVTSFMTDLGRSHAVLKLDSIMPDRFSTLLSQLLGEKRLEEPAIRRRTEMAREAEQNFTALARYLDARTGGSQP